MMRASDPITLSFNRPSHSYFNRFWLETAMSSLPQADHASSSAPSLDGSVGTDSAAKVGGESTERMGPSYGVLYL